MAISTSEREKLLAQARSYNEHKDEVGKDYADNFKFLKSDLSAWYNALTAACFTSGTIAITIGADKSVRSSILHPTCFWLGAVLLIVDGIFIFFLKKLDIEGDLNKAYVLKELRADLWALRNMTIEKANGDNTRADELSKLEHRQRDVYVKTIKPLTWLRWPWQVFKAATTDIVFGLLLFPIALMLTQIIDEFHITLHWYLVGLMVLLGFYLLYMVSTGISAAHCIRKQELANQRIQFEVMKKI